VTYLDERTAEIERHVPPHLLQDTDTGMLFRMYALLALAKGIAVSAAGVHNAWTAWMQDRDPDHPSLKPFAELNADTQAGRSLNDLPNCAIDPCAKGKGTSIWVFTPRLFFFSDFFDSFKKVSSHS
jgi:hypothetical protein